MSSENTVGKGETARSSNFCFSHSVFHPFGELPAIFIKSDIVVCKLFQFRPVRNIVVWERVKMVRESGALRGIVVKCLTRNPGVLGSSRNGSSGFFRGSVLEQDTSEPHPSTSETQERHE